MLPWQEAAGNWVYRKRIEGQMEEEIGAFLPMALPLQKDPCLLIWDHSGSTKRCAQVCLEGLLALFGEMSMLCPVSFLC